MSFVKRVLYVLIMYVRGQACVCVGVCECLPFEPSFNYDLYADNNLRFMAALKNTS